MWYQNTKVIEALKDRETLWKSGMVLWLKNVKREKSAEENIKIWNQIKQNDILSNWISEF